MTPQETDLITTLLSRLKNAAGQPKDADADALIRRAMTEQPDAPYYLAQTVLIQDLSLHTAQNRIAELERQLSDAQAQAARPAPTSFLGGLFGSRQPPAPPQTIPAAGVPAAGPWTRAPQVAAAPMAQPYGQPNQQQPGYGPSAGGGFMGGGPGAGGFMGGGSGAGGFLRSAATTAAGVAGGALLFQGIESLFGHSAGGGFLGGGQGMTPGLGETVVNNYYGSDGAGNQNTDAWGGGDAGGQGSGGDQDFSSAGLGGNQDFSSQDSDQDYGGDQDFSSSDFGGGDSNPC